MQAGPAVTAASEPDRTDCDRIDSDQMIEPGDDVVVCIHMDSDQMDS